LRDPKSVTVSEIIAFQHWVVLVQLLKIGIPYETIMTLSINEIDMIIASEMAMQQKQNEEQAREMAASQAKSSFGKGRF